MPGEYEITGIMLTGVMITEHTVLGDTQITVAIPPGVTVSPTDLTVDEGGTGTYTVVLDTQPIRRRSPSPSMTRPTTRT